MIKLFKETDTVYKTNGEVVINATKCRVSNGDGGEFKLSLTCPISYSKYIENNYIIVVPTPAGEQPFRIYEIEKSQNKIDINARHITYDSMDYVIADSYAVDKTCGEAMEHFNNATDNPSPFSVYSDIEDVNTLRIVRKSLYEAINEVNERWGGHIVRDMFSISNLSQIGRDNGITIEYRKNLQSITATYDFSGVCTKLLPVGRDGTLLDTLYVYSPVQYDIPHTKVVDFEQDIEKDDYPSEEAYIAALKADLLAKATDYVNTYCYPSVNYSLKGKPEKVTDIGDVIKVKDERLGIDILTQVISYEFDCITETYKSLEFGNFTDSLSNLMSNISTSTNETVNKAIQNLPQQNEATEEKSGLMSASDKTKLDDIEAGAQKNVQADWDETDPSADSYIKNKPSSLGDVTGVKGNAESTYRTGNVNLTPANLGLAVKQASQGGADESLVTTGEKYTYLHVADSKADNTPTFTEASTRANLAGSGETMPTILGKVKKFFSDLKAVAFSGSYNDLTDKPTIPAAQVNSDWNATSGVAKILNKPNLAAVATSGAYSDLTGTPTIPTVNNSTITIKKNGTTVDSFTLNQSTGKDIDISVPTKTSDLTNDSGYITSYTDEKVTAEDANPSSDTGYFSLCVPVLSATTNQKPKAPSGYMLSIKNGTSSAVGHAFIRLGNDKASGSSNNKCGKIRLYSQKTKYVDLVTTANMTTADRTITLPDADGTIALTSNIPTKTSDLTNDSGFITSYTDEKVTAEQEAPTTETKYDILFVPSGSPTANQKPKYNYHFVTYIRNGTSSTLGWNYLALGNSTSSGTAGNQYGALRMYSQKNAYVDLRVTNDNTTNRIIYLPNKDGTIALTKDLTTYAFAEGTNNGEIKITPSVGGTAGTAVTVKPKGISDLAYIAKGSGSSKFLREDGTWQTVTASWSGGEVTGRIDTYAPPSDIMPAISPKTAFCGSVGFSNKPYRFGFFQGAVLGASYEEAGTSKMGTLTMYTGLGAYAAVIKPDPSQSASEVDLVLPKTSGTLALTSEIPTKTSDLTNDSGYVTTDEIVEEAETTDSTPYLYRHTKGTGDRLYEKLVGASFGVNQLVNNGDFSSLSSWGKNSGDTLTASNNIATYTPATNSNKLYQYISNATANHVYLSFATLKAADVNSVPTFVSYIGSSGIFRYFSTDVTTYHTLYIMEKQSAIFSAPQIQIRNGGSPLPSNASLQIKNIMCIDLTLMFGIDIADKAYTMEQSTAGSGIAWLKSYGFFTKDYYPFNTGELLSVKPTGKVNIGKNLADYTLSGYYDVSNNGAFIANSSWVAMPLVELLSGKNYVLSKDSSVFTVILYYDANKDFISSITITSTSTYTVSPPSGAKYIAAYGKEQNLQLEFGNAATTYEPYTEYTYPISTELRGVAKLVGDDIVYDGDVDDGKTKEVNYAEYDLSNLNWGYNYSANRWKTSDLRNIGLLQYNSVTWISDKWVANTWDNKTNGDIVCDGNKDVYCLTSDSVNSPTGHLVLKLATHTTEPSNGFTMPQIVSKGGTEQFIDERTVPIPVGHNSEYVDFPNWMEQGYYKDFRNRVDYADDSGWKEISIPTSYAAAGSVILYRKRNEVVEVILNIQAYTTPLDTDTIIGTLPVGYRPKIRIASASYENGSSANYLLIYPNGEVVLHRNVSYLGFNMMFFNA